MTLFNAESTKVKLYVTITIRILHLPAETTQTDCNNTVPTKRLNNTNISLSMFRVSES